jgi:hypothetical protein
MRRVQRSILLAVLLLPGVTRHAAADAQHEEVAQAIREKHPPIRLTFIEAAAAEADERPEEQLVTDLKVTQDFLKKARAKWKAVQARRRANALVEATVVYKWAHDALSWAGTVREKEQRLADIRRREDEEYQARFGVYYHSIFIKKGKELEYENQWYASGRGGAYREEEKQVAAWFLQEIKARAKEQTTGVNPVSTLLDQMQAEAIDEISRLHRAETTFLNALKRKRGEQVEEEAAKQADAEAERHRSEVRLAPVRTEYEAQTGETVATLWQVWKGATPYLARGTAESSVERPLLRELAEGGEFVVPFTFRKPGTFRATVSVTDAQGMSKTGEVTITVTGDPVPEEKPPEKRPGSASGDAGGPSAGAGPSTTAPVPLQGTFQAVLWGGTAGLSRVDMVGEFMAVGAPLTLTIAPDGALSATVRYELPKAEMRTLPPLNPGETPPYNVYWKTSFDLQGKVDWTTGRVSISITNGHDERGYEKDVPGLSLGKGKGPAHWRDWMKADYSCVLEGWTIPGPDAQAWLGSLGKDPGVLQMLKQSDMEKFGMPFLVFAADGAVSYRDRGFCGAGNFDRSPTLAGITPRRLKLGLRLWHTGYDGHNESEKDETAKAQASADSEAKERAGGWYLKLLGAGAAPPEPPAAEPKDDDVLAFGLWPTKPITVVEGSNMSARAMAVFGRNVNDAVDLSGKVSWSASPGLVLLRDGSFSAPTPGTYTLTATLPSPTGPMTSTIQVVVTKK